MLAIAAMCAGLLPGAVYAHGKPRVHPAAHGPATAGPLARRPRPIREWFGAAGGYPRIASLYAFKDASQVPTFSRYDLVVAPLSAAPAAGAYKAANPRTPLVLYVDTRSVTLPSFDGMSIYPGWWLTLAGTRLSAPVDATATTLHVADAGVIAAALRTNADLLIDGETVHVTAVDTARGTLTVARGMYSQATPHVAGARVAAHASSWPGQWMLNVTSYCPVNPATGQRWNDYLVHYVRRQMAAAPWDGVYFDDANSHIRWLANGRIDANNDNLPDAADGPSGMAWSDGMDDLLRRTRSALPGAMILENGGLTTPAASGRVFEHFPYFNYDWNNAFGAYLRLAGPAGAAPTSIINPDTANTGVQSLLTMRFGLATTLMGNGYFAYDFGTFSHGQTWWYDEYDDGAGSSLAGSIDGAATTLTLAPGTGRRFHAGDVVRVPNDMHTSWGLTLDDEQMLVQQVTGDQLHVARGYDGSIVGEHPLGTKVMTAAQIAGGRGWLGEPLGRPYSIGAGGAAALWRRDFTNGAVLLNGSNVARIVSVGQGYRHILGTQDSSLNDGRAVGTIVLPPRDAVLLVKIHLEAGGHTGLLHPGG